jgi:hypothetical protein
MKLKKNFEITAVSHSRNGFPKMGTRIHIRAGTEVRVRSVSLIGDTYHSELVTKDAPFKRAFIANHRLNEYV